MEFTLARKSAFVLFGFGMVSTVVGTLYTFSSVRTKVTCLFDNVETSGQYPGQ